MRTVFQSCSQGAHASAMPIATFFSHLSLGWCGASGTSRTPAGSPPGRPPSRGPSPPRRLPRSHPRDRTSPPPHCTSDRRARPSPGPAGSAWLCFRAPTRTPPSRGRNAHSPGPAPSARRVHPPCVDGRGKLGEKLQIAVPGVDRLFVAGPARLLSPRATQRGTANRHSMIGKSDG